MRGETTMLQRLLAIAAVLAVGCAGGSGDAAAVDSGMTARLELGGFEVPPGEEGFMCQTFANPFGADVEIAEWRANLDVGGHHVLVFADAGGTTKPLARCAGGDFSNPVVFQGQAAGGTSM